MHGTQKLLFPAIGLQAMLDQLLRRSRRVASTLLNMRSSIHVILRLSGTGLTAPDQKIARTIRISCNVSKALSFNVTSSPFTTA